MGIRALAHRKVLLKEVAALRGQLLSSGPALTHWSAVAPLGSQPVKQPGHAIGANLADGQFDEQKASGEFQQAVLQWRREQARPSLLLATGKDAGDAGMWNNPWA
jgi:hypothetical protein